MAKTLYSNNKHRKSDSDLIYSTLATMEFRKQIVTESEGILVSLTFHSDKSHLDIFINKNKISIWVQPSRKPGMYGRSKSQFDRLLKLSWDILTPAGLGFAPWLPYSGIYWRNPNINDTVYLLPTQIKVTVKWTT